MPARTERCAVTLRLWRSPPFCGSPPPHLSRKRPGCSGPSQPQSCNIWRSELSTKRKSLLDSLPVVCVNLSLSTARTWSITATESGPALGTGTTTGGAEAGEALNGTTTGVDHLRFSQSADTITQSRCFLISRPCVGSRLTHQISPRFGFIQVFPVFGIQIQCIGSLASGFQVRFGGLYLSLKQTRHHYRPSALWNRGFKPERQRSRDRKGHLHVIHHTTTPTPGKLSDPLGWTGNPAISLALGSHRYWMLGEKH